MTSAEKLRMSCNTSRANWFKITPIAAQPNKRNALEADRHIDSLESLWVFEPGLMVKCIVEDSAEGLQDECAADMGDALDGDPFVRLVR